MHLAFISKSSFAEEDWVWFELGPSEDEGRVRGLGWKENGVLKSGECQFDQTMRDGPIFRGPSCQISLKENPHLGIPEGMWYLANAAEIFSYLLSMCFTQNIVASFNKGLLKNGQKLLTL